jgi:hypothetical protein
LFKGTQINQSSGTNIVTGDFFKAGGSYRPPDWSTVELNVEELSRQLELPGGIVTSLMRDLYGEGILGEETPTKIVVTQLGKLVYETVGAQGVNHISDLMEPIRQRNADPLAID